MSSDSNAVLARCLCRPAASDDGKLLGVIQHDFSLVILRLVGGSCKVICSYVLAKGIHEFLAHLTILRWSPEVPTSTDDDCVDGDLFLLPHLLLSDGARLLTLNPNALPTSSIERSGSNVPSSRYIVADYQLGDQFGRLTYADFLLDDAHILVMFELGHAFILSVTRPQREDVPNVKFCNRESLAIAPNGKTSALLLRSKGQDQIAVIVRSENGIKIQSTFSTHTADACGIAWSPDGDPVIAVWDSAAYNVNIRFFSALGHCLKQLEIFSFAQSATQEGIGVTAVEWVKYADGTIFAVTDGHKQILVRRQHHKTMTFKQLALLRHPGTIDGTKAIVWQQTTGGEQGFQLEKGTFDATLDAAVESDTTCLKFNCDQGFLATTMADNPKTVWLWQPEHPDPHTIIAFQNNIRQILWHPQRANILLCVTARKTPDIYIWYAETRSPAPCRIPLDDLTSTKFEATWLTQQFSTRCALLVSNARSFNVGSIEADEHGVFFDSLLARLDAQSPGSEDVTGNIETPSRRSER